MHLDLPHRLAAARRHINNLNLLRPEGRVTAVRGLAMEVAGLQPWAAVGQRLRLGSGQDAEIVGFAEGRAQALAFSAVEGLCPGTSAQLCETSGLAVDAGWLGRVLDPLGRPLDGKGPLPKGEGVLPLRRPPPPATSRARLGPVLDLGVKALDVFAPCQEGQRLGLFAASGVGKSTLLSMVIRQARCDVVVLALIGERGRELREFLEDDLGAEGLARSVVVCATSDAAPLMRREAAYAATTVAEYFAAQGQRVLLMMDSVTRFALALREIGLASGEPPATRGYPPSVFAELPRLLERAGPAQAVPDGHPQGSITGLFTVLVEGDDHDEPVADAVRGILDGHVVLSRRIGEKGRYPAVDVLRSLSRTAPACLAPEQRPLVQRARALLATQAEMADLVRLGAYRSGADTAVDEALLRAPMLEQWLCQQKHEASNSADAFLNLAELLGPEA